MDPIGISASKLNKFETMPLKVFKICISHIEGVHANHFLKGDLKYVL